MIKVLISYKNGQRWKTTFSCPFELDSFFEGNKHLIQTLRTIN